MHVALVGRQPIYDRKLDVYAYELLFRDDDKNRANVVDGNAATSKVILNTFAEIGLQRIVGDRPAFLNLTRDFFVEGHAKNLPPERVVLEVLEDVTVDDRLVGAVEELAAAGYTIALDDYDFNEEMRPLLPHAQMIKVDLTLVEQEVLARRIEELKRHDVMLLAEKVETKEEFDACKAMGFDLFQGYFLSKPTVVSHKKVPANRLAALRLVARLDDPEAPVSELEAIIAQDVSLTYKLLRIINSALYALPRKVETIREALVMLGIEQVRSWAALIAMNAVTDKPPAVMMTAIVRGKMCELLGRRLRVSQPSVYFTMGMLSALDILLDLPMDEVVASLPLSPDLNGALLERQGTMGAVLDCVLAYERCDLDAAAVPGLTAEEIRDAYLDALEAAEAAGSLLGAR